MTMTVEELRSCIGRAVVDRDGEQSGKVESVFNDTATNEPAWLAVHTGWFGRRSTLVPLAGAHTKGDTIQVPYDKETIKSAPAVADDQPIDSQQATELMEHYGLRNQARDQAGERTTRLPPGGDPGEGTPGEGTPDEETGHVWMEPRSPTASTIGTKAAADLDLDDYEEDT